MSERVREEIKQLRKWARISVPTFVCDRDEGAIKDFSHKDRGGKKRQGTCNNAAILREKVARLGMVHLP